MERAETASSGFSVRIGTAGWAIPRAVADRFAETGSSLARYSSRFTAAEINSSFHRPHRPGTYAGWAAAVPDGFRFAVKIPKTVTHVRKLVDADAELERFVEEIRNLGAKLGPLLVQLPPSLGFDETVAESFCRRLRALCPGPIACEPRHPSWFEDRANDVMRDLAVARVAADPVRAGTSAEPGGWPGLVYLRLHGAPRMYYSEYAAEDLARLARRIFTPEVETWCIFDNTASGAACLNGLDLLALAPKE